jgi:hypothetical protein
MMAVLMLAAIGERLSINVKSVSQWQGSDVSGPPVLTAPQYVKMNNTTPEAAISFSLSPCST